MIKTSAVILTAMAQLLLAGPDAIADDSLMISNNDKLKLKLEQEPKNKRFVLSISARTGDQVKTARQDCKTRVECEDIKKSIEATHGALKDGQTLALQLNETAVVAKVVSSLENEPTQALMETILKNFPTDGVIQISGDGLMTQQEYSLGEQYKLRCWLISRNNEPLLVKNNGILISAGPSKSSNISENYIYGQCSIPISHSHVTAIYCNMTCGSFDLADLNTTFKGRLSFYFPPGKVVRAEQAENRDRPKVAKGDDKPRDPARSGKVSDAKTKELPSEAAQPSSSDTSGGGSADSAM